ncbi:MULTISPECIES: hypothetical protein [Ponticoccus]|uniref:Secreted protein n=1 Tax=Ponticoccus litoralis TaxID=422297 RepID=A0AAW9SD31_9RHOB
MSLTTLVAAASLGLVSLTATEAETPKTLIFAQAAPFIGTQGYIAPQGDYMTTAQGCTYRRTQAPGYPPRWILVLNPKHIGLPNSPRSCKGMM